MEDAIYWIKKGLLGYWRLVQIILIALAVFAYLWIPLAVLSLIIKWMVSN